MVTTSFIGISRQATSSPHRGLVKLLASALPSTFTIGRRGPDDLTSLGAIAGTLHYMSPEQFADTPSVDYQCDLEDAVDPVSTQRFE
jgi:hypothetical protein